MYREHPPHPALRRYVECYWSIDARLASGAALENSVLPDGCMDILFRLDDAPSGAGGVGPGPHVIGTMTRALDVSYEGALRLVGVRFRPGGATPFLACRAVELTDRTAPLDAIWGRAASSEAHERLTTAGSGPERTRTLDALLLARLQGRTPGADERVLAAAELAAARAGAVAIDDLAAVAGLGRRQLERRFLATVGISPKRMCRVSRFRKVVGALYADPRTPLSRLAHRCGYADQPHLTREFTEMAGVSPAAYRRTVRHRARDANVQDARALTR